MKIAVVLGADWCTIRGTSQSKMNVFHCAGSYHIGCAEALVRAGHEVDMLTFNPEDSADGWSFGIQQANSVDVDKYDVLVSIDGLFWNRPEAARWAHSKAVRVEWSNCFDAINSSKYVNLISLFAVNTLGKPIMDKYVHRFGQNRVFYVPQAGSVWPYVASPYYDNGKPKVFWTGITYIQFDILGFLNKLANYDDIEVWIAALFPISITGDTIRGLTDAERQRFLNPKIHLVSDFFGQPLGHGPVYCGQYAGYLIHADIGIHNYAGPHASAKVYEYLLNGLPVVIPDTCCEWEVVKKMGGGDCFRLGDADDAHDKITRLSYCIKPDNYRASLRTSYSKIWGWDMVVKTIIERVQKHG